MENGQPKITSERRISRKQISFVRKKIRKKPSIRKKVKRNNQPVNMSKGYTRKLTQNEIRNTSDITSFIPHHCVLNSKKSDKVRAVFDAGAKFKGISLNDNLLKGPDLLNSLITILIRFRLGQYAVIADIKQMFHQLKVRESDQDALRFLWGTTKFENPVEYVMNVHLSGKNDSPCVVNYGLKRCAKDQSNNFNAKTVECVDKDFYMDDFTKSNDSEKYLLTLSNELIEMFLNCSFRLTKWLSKGNIIMSSLPQGEFSPKFNSFNERIVKRVLGILWDINNDTLKLNLITKRFSDTKRGVLSFLCSIFDPLGFLSSCFLEIKLLIQDLWRNKLNWDDLLPSDLQKKWKYIQENFSYVYKIEVPRFYGFNSLKGTTELHLVSDSSSDAFGCVVYFRNTTDKNLVNVSFLIRKSRLAPLNEKTLSIPKLELQAAVTAACIKNKLIEEAELNVNRVFFWTDSKTVLKYIKNDNKRFPVFMTHPVTEIWEHSNKNEWHYISSKFNVADDCTRPIKLEESHNNCHYLNGLKFLRCLELPIFSCIEDSFPVNLNNINFESKYLKEDEGSQKKDSNFIFWERFSNWNKLVGIIALVFKFSKHWLSLAQKNQSTYQTRRLLLEDLAKSKYFILKTVQEDKFARELTLLKQNLPLHNSKILPLQPFIRNKLLHVGERLEYSFLLEESKHPIILPKDHHVTKTHS